MDDKTNRFSPRSTGLNSAKAELIKRQAKMLFSAFRRDDFAEPELFFAQLGVVFEEYPEEVILAVTSPKTGLQRRLKFPPTIAEVVEACDAEAIAIDTRNRYSAMPAPVPRLPRYRDQSPGRRANVFVHADAPQYLRCCELAKTLDSADWKLDPAGRPGIWISYHHFLGANLPRKDPFDSVGKLQQIAGAAWNLIPEAK